MTYYARELQRIKSQCFSNEQQLSIAVGTKRYLDRHFDEAISLEQLAQAQATSKYNLLRIFKKYLGVTPRQYLIDKRIEQAKRLLQQGRSVSDACYLVGYGSIQSFSALFKGRTGLSPTAYQRATFDKPKP